MATIKKKKVVVVINYRQSLGKMIKDGNYDSVQQFINSKNFLIKGTGQQKREIFLINFGQKILQRKVVDYMKKNNLRPVVIEELVAVGNQYPKIQGQSAVCALGTIFHCRQYPMKGMVFFPLIDRVKSISGITRNLLLFDYDPDYQFRDKTTRFAAVSTLVEHTK